MFLFRLCSLVALNFRGDFSNFLSEVEASAMLWYHWNDFDRNWFYDTRTDTKNYQEIFMYRGGRDIFEKHLPSGVAILQIDNIKWQKERIRLLSPPEDQLHLLENTGHIAVAVPVDFRDPTDCQKGTSVRLQYFCL